MTTAALAQFPVVALLGPRQVGKTTLAHAIVDALPGEATYLDLERPADRAVLADADRWLRSRSGLVVLDEIHRVPDLFPVLRGIVDERRRGGDCAGHFLVLGSASLDRQRQASESLAGRIAAIELTPVQARELAAPDLASIDQLWQRGGFPDSIFATSDAASFEWRRQFVRSYLERDIPTFGPRVPAETMRRLWTMLAHSQGAPINVARLASGLGVSGQSVGRWIDLLVDLLLLRRLEPFAANVGKRLVRTPRTYLRDTGIAHALLAVSDLDALLGHPAVGGSWESFVIEQLLAAAPTSARASYYRTARGAEIDLVLERGSTERWAIEIKRSSTPRLAPGFHIAVVDIEATRRIVVHTGEQSFPMGSDVEAMTLLDAVTAVAGWRT